jgi:hypothetical protein
MTATVAVLTAAQCVSCIFTKHVHKDVCMHVYDKYELMMLQQIPSLCLSSLRSYYVSKLSPSVLMTSSSITNTIQYNTEREREREREIHLETLITRL